jgi:hypothetical protein
MARFTNRETATLMVAVILLAGMLFLVGWLGYVMVGGAK